jgi:molybdate transport system ATP-binding protein
MPPVSSEKKFLSVNNITIRVGHTFLFHNTNWQMHEKEQWLIIGPNGSGKSTFAKALAGILPLKYGEIICHFIKKGIYPYPQLHKDKIVYLAFETQQKFLQKDSLKRDLASYMGMKEQGTMVKDFLGNNTNVVRQFGMDIFLNREIATLSTGEMRKIFLIKSFLAKPKLLILDEPFDGLDIFAKKAMKKIISFIMKKSQVVLITHKQSEMISGITHVLVVNNGKITAQGKREQMIQQQELFQKKQQIHKNANNLKKKRGLPLIIMKDINVKFEKKVILDHIDWIMYEGENWAIIGPNGSGKSTLMHLITGDQQQGYANNITLFGKRKNETPVWEIKEKVGIVSTDLMIRYNKEIKALDVILSGFFDSIGLYKKISKKQKIVAEKWIKILTIEKIAAKNYHELSFGQKRLILIARAVIKSPKLLILDEPCHGLDKDNREMVLQVIQKIGEKTKTNILLITHEKEEIVPCITHTLHLNKGKIV